jgi:hypothetical protein
MFRRAVEATGDKKIMAALETGGLSDLPRAGRVGAPVRVSSVTFRPLRTL